MENSESNDLLGRLLDEYYFCQKLASEIDQQTLSFKNWSIAFSGIILGWALTQDRPLTLLIPLISAIMFWYSEGLWKEKVKIFTDRVRDLEKMIADEKTHNYKGPKISRNHMYHYKDAISTLVPKRLFYRTVMLPHAVIAVVSIMLFVFKRFIDAA